MTKTAKEQLIRLYRDTFFQGKGFLVGSYIAEFLSPKSTAYMEKRRGA